METVTGKVEKFLFRNEDSGYGVVSLKKKDGDDVVVNGAVGTMRVGTTVECQGVNVMTKYGVQLKVSSWTEHRPEDVEGIEKYLASGLIKNIGPVLAHDIVEVFGEDTLDVLDNSPERLREVQGIGDKRIKSIVKAVKEQKAIRGVMIWLKRYDLPNGLAAKIYKTYGDRSVRVLEENPYRLADDIKGVGFKKADAVAALLGLPAESEFRLRSGMLHAVGDFTEQGSTYMPKELMLETAASADYLNIEKETVESEFARWMSDSNRQQLVLDGDRVYPFWLYHAECGVSERLKSLMGVGRNLFSGMQGSVDIRSVESRTGVEYNRHQAEAVSLSLKENILVLTGGPGTGKTVTTNGIITALEADGGRVLLCAPTGRAAKRMSEVTGRPAKTIHRLLGFSGEGFSFNKDCPLRGKAIVVDEASMVDIQLMRNLLAAVPDGMKVILVGDVDQLPSVGSGSVLRDIIDSGVVPTVRLTEIYRQAQGSEIIMGAHAINEGRMPKLDNHKGSDLAFIDCDDPGEISNKIVRLVTERLPKQYGISPEDIQVLTPMRRQGDVIGTTELNSLLQAELIRKGYLPERCLLEHLGRRFHKGDRVMQIKNDYTKNVFNGDTGTVIAKTEEDGLLIDFDGTPEEYTRAELATVELAYASTVHKSQGSEYPVVIIPVHKSHYILLKRNLLYTAITRAKKYCILVGTSKAVAMAVYREETENRYSYLAERLKGSKERAEDCAEGKGREERENDETEDIDNDNGYSY